jgi:hypothetical protein
MKFKLPVNSSWPFTAPFLVALVALCFGFLSFTVGGCTTASQGSIVTIPPEARGDDDYIKVLQKWQKSARVFDQFQNRIQLNSVLFTEEMRQAYLNRWVRLRGDTASTIGMDSGGKLAIFVSLYTPDEDFLRLDNSSLWTVRLQYGDKTLTPTTVLRLYEKPVYEGFFDFVNKWSSEYLVVFDVSLAESSEAVNLPESLSAQFYSSLAYLNLQWR